MNFERSIFFPFPAILISFFWVAAVEILENLLAPTGISIFAAGILVVVPALVMEFSKGIFTVLLSGFFVDASFPLPFEHENSLIFHENSHGVYLLGEIAPETPEFFGFVTGWLVFAFLALRFMKIRFTFSNPLQWIFAAEILNTTIFFFWALAMGGNERIFDSDYWVYFGINLVVSSFFLIVSGAWFFDMIFSIYRLFGVDLQNSAGTAENETEAAEWRITEM